MKDISARSKWLFWMMILTVALFAAVPSIVLVEKLGEYRRFLSGGEPGTLKPSKVSALPHSGRSSDTQEPVIQFVEFSLEAPAARSVGLSASFNSWKPEAMPLEREPAGPWRTVVALPPGSHYYAFDVDGAWTVDPAAGGTIRLGGREVSTRKVP